MAATKEHRAATSPLALRQLMLRELYSVARDLRKRNALDGDIVHAARKTLKRARASLRLLREFFGQPFYIRENAQLRDAARPLGRLRDAQVLREKLEGLLENEKDAKRRGLLLSQRQALNAGWHKLRKEAERGGTMNKSAAIIEAVTVRMRRQRLGSSEHSIVQTGLGRIYRKGRVALAETEADQLDENLHELRKQAKYLGQAMKILAPGAHGKLANCVKRADAVADSLGDDHDLVLLQAKIATLRVRSTETHESVLAHKRQKLQKKALKRARRLYREKPGVFLTRLRNELSCLPNRGLRQSQ